MGVHRQPVEGDRALLRRRPKPREATRRLCPVVGSWPDKDFTTKAAAILETKLTEAGVPHDLKVYQGTKHAFFNDTLRTYSAGAGADSWQRVLAFFEGHVERTTNASSDPRSVHRDQLRFVPHSSRERPGGVQKRRERLEQQMRRSRAGFAHRPG